MFACGLRLSLLWGAIGMALANDCSEPMPIENAHFKVNKNVVTYHCDGGFKPEATRKDFNCKKGKWETIKFSCLKTCGPPPDLPNANIVQSEENSVYYQCQSNLNSAIEIACNGTLWKNLEVQCAEPIKPDNNNSMSSHENGTWDKMNTTVVPGNAVSCNGSNDDNITCKLQAETTQNSLCIDGFINGTNISCTYINSETCPEPINIPNSIIQGNDGGYIVYNCKPDYIQIGNISTSTCENGTWTEPNMTCFPENFGECTIGPINMPNALMQWDSEGYVVYTCQQGYTKAGNISTAFCENGTWTEIDLTCFPESCGPLDPVKGSIVTYDGNMANFTCEDGFLQEGNVSVSFCENGTWSEINTVCISEAEIAEEYRQRQKSQAFQDRVRNSDNLICSFTENEQICQCNNEFAVIDLKLNQKIAKHNFFSTPVESLEECENLCLQNKSCLSLEYIESSKICQLSKTASYLVESFLIMNAKGVIYGQKVCAAFRTKEQNYLQHEAFNLDAVPPNLLLCSISPKEIFCGCVEGIESFVTYPKKKIARHNMGSFRTDDQSECFARCQNTQDCLSGEFKKHKKICQLSRTAHYLADEIIFLNSPDTLYFEKQCSPFDSAFKIKID